MMNFGTSGKIGGSPERGMSSSALPPRSPLDLPPAPPLTHLPLTVQEQQPLVSGTPPPDQATRRRSAAINFPLPQAAAGTTEPSENAPGPQRNYDNLPTPSPEPSLRRKGDSPPTHASEASAHAEEPDNPRTRLERLREEAAEAIDDDPDFAGKVADKIAAAKDLRERKDRGEITEKEHDETIALEQALTQKRVDNLEARQAEIHSQLALAQKTLTHAMNTSKDHVVEREQYRLEAATDHLTGIPNRRALEREAISALEEAEANGTRVSIFAIDGDGFKAINDTHGDPIGDKVVIALAQAIQHNIRENDTCGRRGGDEFTAVINGTTLEEDEIIARRIQHAVKEGYTTPDGREIPSVAKAANLGPGEMVTVSIAIVGTDTAGYRFETLDGTAYRALKKEKKAAKLRGKSATITVVN